VSAEPAGGLRLGVVLPSFRERADEALAAAAAAEAAGLHGVFAYDHLWPMGQPGRPAISPYPLLGAVAAMTTRVSLGTLVARVGLVAPAVLLSELRSLAALAPGRVIAAVGTGDAKSAAENRAFGLTFAPPEQRRAALAEVVSGLIAAGITVWVGGGAPATDAVARAAGAVLNCWNPPRERLVSALGDGPTSWGGMLPRAPGAAAALLADLAGLGVSWAVVNWPGGTDALLAAADAAGVALAAPNRESAGASQ